MTASKIGLTEHRSNKSQKLISDLYSILESGDIDMTIFFRTLSSIETGPDFSVNEASSDLKESYYQPLTKTEEHWQALNTWIRDYVDVLSAEGSPDKQRQEQMNQVNPKYVLRNYMAQMAIDSAEQGDLSVLQDLQTMLKNPYDEQPQFNKWAMKRPDWAKDRPGCSMLSCIS